MTPRPPAPRLLVSARSLASGSLAPRERLRELSARHHDPRSLAVALDRALGAGAEAVLAVSTPGLRAAFAELGRPVPLVAVMGARFEHDRLPPEPAVTGWPPRARPPAGPWTGVRRAWTALTHGGAHRSLAAVVACQLESEAATLPRRGIHGVALAARVVDLALAADHRAFFERSLRFMRARFGVPAAFETRNLGVLLARLEAWSLAPDYVLGAVNPLGVQMKPSAAETLAALARTHVPVVAGELRAGGLVSLAEGAEYARAHGAHGLAPDLADVEDAGAAFRALAAASPSATSSART